MGNHRIWKISDFVEELNQTLNQNMHSNTVDGWFKRLEQNRIHYINRTEDTNEKVYDELDFKIAVFIRKRREEKWSLSAIEKDLPNFVELRPFPLEEGTNTPHVVDIELIKKQLKDEMYKTFEEMAATKIEEVKAHYESLLKGLPKPLSEVENREQRFQTMVIHKRVEGKLEEEAIREWSKLPEGERLKKAGFFRKEVDIEKKNEFIRGYINKHFESKLREEMGLND